ncbi:DUF98 domain-containing protein [bacterium AH-315-L15]|nr:DUF98 domain-containing protein [bacterium AH-315-L15]
MRVETDSAAHSCGAFLDTPKRFQYDMGQMEQQWMTLENFWVYCRNHPVSPLLRMLISSDGTLVRSFTSLFLAPITVELVEQKETVIDDVSAERLEIPKGEKAFERTVWLSPHNERSEDKRCLYAVSLFPIAKMQPALYQDMRLGEKPIGRIIEERGLSALRDRLEIAYLPFPEVAKGLNQVEESLFWARRYRLTLSEHISAIISEVLSPRLSSFSS